MLWIAPKADAAPRRLRGRSAVSRAVESLEPRRLLSTVTWTSANGGNWSSPSNWTDDLGANRVPTALDTVIISPAGAQIINVDGTQAALSVAVTGDDTLSVSGTLGLGTDSSIRHLAVGVFGTVNAGGTLMLNGTSSLATQAILGGTGTIVNSGAMTITGASARVRTELQITGSLSVLAGAGFGTDAAAGKVRVLGGGSANVQAAYIYTQNGGAGLIAETGGAVTMAASSNAIGVDGGTLNVNPDAIYGAASTLIGKLNNATINVAAGAQLSLGINSNLDVSGTITGTGTGTVFLGTDSGMTLTADTTFNFAPNMLQLSGRSSIGGSGVLTNNGAMSVYGSGYFTLSTKLLNNGTYRNANLTYFSGTTGELRNKLGGVINGGGAFDRINAASTAPGLFIESGSTIYANEGGFDFRSLLPLSISNATLKADSNFGMSFSSANTTINSADFQITGGGLVTFNDQSITSLAGTIKGSGAIDQITIGSGATINIPAAGVSIATTTAGLFRLISPAINGPGKLTIDAGSSMGVFGTPTVTNEVLVNGGFNLDRGSNPSLILNNGGLLHIGPTGSVRAGSDSNGQAIYTTTAATPGSIKIELGGVFERDFTGAFTTMSVNVAVDNLGTIRSAGLSNINLNGGIAQIVGSPGSTTLIGGRYEILDAASLSFNGQNINTLGPAASVLRGGHPLRFSALNSLSNLQGSLELTQAIDLPFGSSFTNSGTLILGPGTQMSVGSYAQTSAGSIEFQINGTTSDQIGQLLGSSSAILNGSAIVRAASGYTPATNDGFTLQSFTSYTGAYATVQGLNLAANTDLDPVYTSTNFSVNIVSGGPTGSADLGVTAITPPAAGTVGQDITLSYTVTNSGGPTAVGAWTDTIYLSKNGILDANDVILAKVAHNGTLAGGGVYTGNVTVPLVGVLSGNYHLIIVADSRGNVADVDRVNNTSASVATIAVTMPFLTPDVPTNGTIKAGQNLYYQVTLPAGKTPTFAFTGAVAGAAEVFVALGKVPTIADFDYATFDAGSALQRVTGTVTSSATYIIMLRGRENAGNGVGFSLVASGAGFDLVSTSVPGGSSSGRVTTTLTGSQFTPGTAFSLTRGAVTRVADSVSYIDSQHVSVTFNLTGLANGTYNIVANEGSETDALVSAFSVSTGVPAGQLQYRVTAPSGIRPPYLNAAVTITYSNVGKTDINAPVFELLATNARMRLSNGGNFVPAAYTAADGRAFNVYELLGTSSGLAGVLSPGETGSITAYFEPIDASSHSKSTFEAIAMADSANSQPMSYDRIGRQFRPAGIANDAWSALMTNFRADAGVTFGSYRTMLINNANYLGQFGSVSPDVSGLIQFQLEKSNLFGELSNRYVLGAFGRGMVGPYSTRVEADGDGNVSLTDGKTLRFFLKSGNAYVGVNGDRATLSKSGSIFTLTELSKAKQVFRADGKLDYQQDPNGNRLTMGYNGSAQLTSVTNSRTGDVTTYAYNAAGRISSMTDPLGRATTFGFDAGNEHLTTVASAAGTITRTYNPDHSLASATGFDGVTTTYTYDGRGRQTARTVGQGAGAYNVSTTYTGPGVVTVNDGSGPETYYLTYGGKPARIIDSLGRAVTYKYNANGSLLSLTDPTGLSASTSTVGDSLGVSNSDRSQTQLDYDQSNGRVSAITGPAGDVISLGFDSRGNRTSTVLPDGSTDTLEFDSTGRIIASTDANGVRSTYTYNSKNLVTARAYSTGETITYTYDSHRNRLTATGPEGTTTYTYDSLDRVTGVSYPNGRSITTTYDAANRRSTVQDDAGYTVRYTYDALGRLSQVRDTANNLVVGYTYNAANQLALETRGNGGAVAYAYDAAGQIATITHRNAASAVVETFSYVRDVLGRVVEVTSNAGTTAYTYDAAGQLIGASLPGGRTITYSYDVEGNRTQVSDSAAGNSSYASNLADQYTSGAGATYTYDTAGRMITRTEAGVTTTYSYNYAGMLVGESSPGNVISYQYDAFNMRIGKTVNGVQTDFAIDPSGLGTVFGEYTGATSTNYVNALGIAARSSGGSTAYYHFDATGNTAYLSAASGASVQTYSYLPFGEIASQSGSIAQPFTFGGRVGVQGDGNDLYHMRARTYDARVGRFMSRDPLVTDGGDTNLYRFVMNDPVNRVDPSGLMFSPPVLAALESFNEFGFPLMMESAAGLAAMTESTLAWTLGYTAREVAHAAELAEIIEAGIGPAIDTALEGGSGIASDVIAEGLAAHSTNMALVQAEVSRRAEVAAATRAAQLAAATELGAGVLSGAGLFLAAAYAIDGGELLYDSSPFAALTRYTPQDVLGSNTTNYREPKEGASELMWDLYSQKLDGTRTPAEALREAIEFLRKNGIYDPIYNPHPKPINVENFRPHDPNNILGPAGAKPDGLPDTIAPEQTRFDGFVTAVAPYDYKIEFENKASATAPAQVVTVTQTLDSDLDLSTFKFTGFGFGDTHIDASDAPIGTTFSTIYDATASVGVKVKIEASLNLSTRVLTVVYTSLDPVTNDLPLDPLAGFLPPNLSDPEGDGYLAYRVAPKAGLASGTRFDARASIVFDTEDAILTPSVHNTLDIVAPSSSVSVLPATTTTPAFNLNWAGNDGTGGSGVDSYDVYVSDNGGAYVLLLDDTASTSTTFSGVDGHTYGFYSVAVDSVGNIETAPANPDATTTVQVGTTPVPTTVTLQGESAALAGGTAATNAHPGFNGTGFADFGGKNSSATFALTRTASGATTLTFRYANGSNAGRPLSVLVNNVVVGTVTFAPTGAWTNWQNAVLNNVTLPAGTVSIKLVATSDAGGPNVDQLTVANGATPTDGTPPSSKVNTLPATTTAASFTVSWSGTDNAGGVGLKSYNIYVSDNGAAYTLFRSNTTATSAAFSGTNGHTYRFYSVAVDHAGNTEAAPSTPDATTKIQVSTSANRAPVATSSGPAGGVRGQPLRFDFAATDRDTGDAAAGFKYVVSWGDGRTTTVYPAAGNAGGVSLVYIYANAGTYNVTVVAYDRHNLASTAVTRRVGIAEYAVLPDTANPSKASLFVGGSTGNDVIRFDRSVDGRVKLIVNNVVKGLFNVGSSIQAFGQGGNDHISVSSQLGLTAYFSGGDGNDTLLGTVKNDTLYGNNGDDLIAGYDGNDILDSGVGNDIVVGGRGSDILRGAAGRDLLFGGAEADRLDGGEGEDVIVAGTTSYDAQSDFAAFRAMRSEWVRGNIAYATRVAHLIQGGGNNGASRLSTATTASGDDTRDTLYGGSDTDAFWASRNPGIDLLPDAVAGERVTRA